MLSNLFSHLESIEMIKDSQYFSQCTNLMTKDKLLGACVLGGFMLARYNFYLLIIKASIVRSKL